MSILHGLRDLWNFSPYWFGALVIGPIYFGGRELLYRHQKRKAWRRFVRACGSERDAIILRDALRELRARADREGSVFLRPPGRG